LPKLEKITPSQKHQNDGITSTNVVKINNAGLLLSRYIPQQVIRNDKSDAIIEINRKGNEVTYQTLRNLWFEYFPINFTRKNTVFMQFLDNTYKRWEAMTKSTTSIRFSLVNRGRLVVGLGGKGPLEIGITLHPITGLPYIPGSALKGLCRSYTLLFLAARWKVEVETKALKQLDEALCGITNGETEILEPELAELYKDLFGTQTEAGQCVFFDAIVQSMLYEESLFTVDVMTPHFEEYYRSQGNKAPHDADNPNPIAYITVTEGTVFRFAIGLRNNAQTDKGILRDARELLQAALQELGVGAKTAQGYGVFAPVK
jgi:CRISPR-associated protein Cmr6